VYTRVTVSTISCYSLSGNAADALCTNHVKTANITHFKNSTNTIWSCSAIVWFMVCNYGNTAHCCTVQM